MAGAIGYVSDQFTAAQIDDVRQAVLDLASRALTDRAVDKIITPTIDDVLGGGRLDVISVGFVLALWSGSRAMHVFVDTITIMHGLGGHRGIIKTRALSFGLYLLAMLTGVVSIPLIVAGPSLVRAALPDQLDFLMAFYWPAVLVLSICFLATLYHVSVPVRTNWTFNLPGRRSRWPLDPGLLRSCAGSSRHGSGLALDLRAARHPDRGAAVALPRRDRRAHRRGGERVVRLGLPPEVDDPRPPRAGPAAAPADGAGGGRGIRRVGGAGGPEGLGSGRARRPACPGAHPRRPSARSRMGCRTRPLALVGAGPPDVAAAAILISTASIVYFDRNGLP